MGSYFNFMLFSEGLNSFIIVFKLKQLLFEFFTSGFKFLFDFLHVDLHILRFDAVLFLDPSLFFERTLLVHFEFFLGILPLLDMLWLQSLDLITKFVIFFGLENLSFLFLNYIVGFFQNDFHFFLVSVGDWSLVNTVLFIFRMQVENDLG